MTLLFLLLLGALAAQRLLELQLSESNRAHLLRLGAYEVGAAHYPVMVLLHTTWFAAMIWERTRGYRPLELWWLPLLGLGMLFVGQSLRWLAISELGRRWTTRVLIVPGAQPVTSGPFRWLRHPNYLGVLLEIFGVPLIGGCWRTSLLFGLANLALLARRIAVEQRALEQEAR